jgi:glutamine amidotransferase
VSGPAVVVLDYGSGNLRSAQRALARAGARVQVSADPAAALDADGLVIPGVGAFQACVDAMRAVGGDRIAAQRLAAGRAVLGICVGMQILFDRGDEHGQSTPGLGLLAGTVERLDAPVLPHIGWNTVEAAPDSVLLAGLAGERFYFVHSYAARTAPGSVSTATHGQPFVAAVEDGPLSATQFHPEKSADAGARLLANWVGTL